MPTLVLPKRRFAPLRRAVRKTFPKFYGWALGNPRMRSLFSLIKGRQTVEVGDDLSQRFTKIYETHYWVDDESRSGGGSNLYATENIRKEIPRLLSKFGVRSVLDCPCGDFVWFKEMSLELDRYIGADIVRPLIEDLSEKYTSEKRSFQVLDLTRDRLPDCDLILVRDCFIHLTFEQISLCVKNIARSNIRWILATNHSALESSHDLEGRTFHPVNLMLPPFCFPAPMESIDDYSKGNEPHQLCLWEVSNLAKSERWASSAVGSGLPASGLTQAWHSSP